MKTDEAILKLKKFDLYDIALYYRVHRHGFRENRKEYVRYTIRIGSRKYDGTSWEECIRNVRAKNDRKTNRPKRNENRVNREVRMFATERQIKSLVDKGLISPRFVRCSSDQYVLNPLGLSVLEGD